MGELVKQTRGPYRMKHTRVKVRVKVALDPIKIKASVLNATEDELIAAGYGDIERHKIPEDWRKRPRNFCVICKERHKVYGQNVCAACAAKTKSTL